MDESIRMINLNTAEIEDLTSLPGVGPALARRIIAARPFNSLEELRQVSGVKQAAYERLAPLVYVSAPEVESADQIIEEPPVAEAEMVAEAPPFPEIAPEPPIEAVAPAIEEAVEKYIPEEPIAVMEPAEQPEPVPPEVEPAFASSAPAEKTAPTAPAGQAEARPAPRVVTLNQAVSMAFTSGILSCLLSIGLVLGILLLLNGGLRFVSPTELSSVQRQVGSIETQATSLRQDLQGLRTRLDNLEGLSGRVKAVEQENQELRSGLDKQLEQLKQLNQQIGLLKADIEELLADTARFQQFLDGLRELLTATGGPDGN
ncbi:MAG: helix-hairpin-helix domain-containing protein [Anaerolineales bacterium]|nr:helix-hairpin-helix domain-containing protein [Anaerolineales bacterium]